MPSSPIRVVVADDHPAFRAGIVTLLDSAPDISVVGEADDGPSALEVAGTVRPDVVLTDVRMPGATGIDITPQLCSQGIRVLAISAFGLDEYVLDAIAAGADGYLVKTERPANIIAAVRSVSRGEAALSNETTAAVVAALRTREGESGGTPEPPDAEVHLTGREEEVLALIAEGHANRRIAGELFISETTVKTHLGNLFAKLGVTSRVQAALWHGRHR
ncbi:MAG: response regulator [Mycobacteriaceae bacterium]|uniref:response regulator n=1 Tax=Corynebacterium sp. TaxID=1720 RepID=UPI003F9C82F9